MTVSDEQNLVVRPVDGQRGREVLAWLAGDLATALPDRELGDRGVLAASHDGRLVGALCADVLPGRVGSLIGPKVEPPGNGRVAAQLIAVAKSFLAERQVSLAQALVPFGSQIPGDWFAAAGFDHVVQLDFLVSSLDGVSPDAVPDVDESLACVAGDEAGHQRIGEVLMRTYEGSQDCPFLNGQREPADVLATYCALCGGVTEHWYLLRHTERDAGCLLLADDPSADQFEMVYMGIVPELRGHGLGLKATRHAQRLARRAGRRRLTLGVDAANEPAQAVYGEAGFIRWDRQQAMVCFL